MICLHDLPDGPRVIDRKTVASDETHTHAARRTPHSVSSTGH